LEFIQLETPFHLSTAATDNFATSLSPMGCYCGGVNTPMTPTHLVLLVVLQWKIFCPEGIVLCTNLVFGNSSAGLFERGIFLDLLDQNLKEGSMGLEKKISNTTSYERVDTPN
jgi:hypothetical protein